MAPTSDRDLLIAFGGIGLGLAWFTSSVVSAASASSYRVPRDAKYDIIDDDKLEIVNFLKKKCFNPGGGDYSDQTS